jgi:hypothetical protein
MVSTDQVLFENHGIRRTESCSRGGARGAARPGQPDRYVHARKTRNASVLMSEPIWCRITGSFDRRVIAPMRLALVGAVSRT